ncbi:protein of unknown function [Mucilaginibacter mallensis]|uniref:DUF4249 domain-containing protein n=1 Tax=Mucilaginibacter mallensis TaxID=652787 RepID=A0A1H2CE04_MUCMA|nr:DUF4249 family protein [Mucilaginibacter mallensis]SDT68482.1 protein of unknown function [Mucilaginibacter mallensis]
MKIQTLLIALFLFTLFCTSCQKVITPPLSNGAAQLVIEGTVSDTSGPYHVNISKTISFYADNTYPNVSGASVTITDETAGVNDLLSETSAGIYTTHTIIGTPGHTYQLQVVVNGQTYNSVSTMPLPVSLDSISFDYTAVKNMIQPTVHYRDPAAFVNYYKYNIWVNGVKLRRFQTDEDRLMNGRYISEDLSTDTGAIRKNNLVLVSLVGVDKGAYNFLMEAANIAFYNDQLSSPATPASNIFGGCMGYFSAQTVSSKSSIVK